MEIPPASVLADPDHPGYHEIRIDGGVPAAEYGVPALPALSFWVGVPPGASVQVDAQPLEEDEWDGIRPMPVPTPRWDTGPTGEAVYSQSLEESEEAYRSPFPPATAVAGREAGMRYLRAVPVTIFPARWDPSGGVLRVARRVRVHVSFVPGPAPRSGARGASLVPVSADDPSWERTYDALLVNAREARAWARAPRAVAPAARRPGAEGDEVKIEVMSSGLRRIAYDDVAPLGWSGAGAPLADLRLYDVLYDSDDASDPLAQETEIPVLLRDNDGSGTWSAGDELFFYAQILYDRYPEAPWHLKRYGRRHVYWLALRPGGDNARMESASTWLGREDLNPVVSSPWREHFEKEAEVYGKMGAGSSNSIDLEGQIGRGVAAVRSKHAYWLGGDPYTNQGGEEANVYSVPFDLPGFVSARAMSVQMQGTRKPPGGWEHRVSLFLQGDGPRVALPGNPDTIDFQGTKRIDFTADDLAGLPLRERNNAFVHLQDETLYGAALDWFEVEYDRAPKFVDGRIDIDTADLTGAEEWRLIGPPADPVGIEYTDPLHPRALAIDPTQVQGGPPKLRLQWELDGNARRFSLGEAALVPKPETLALAQPVDLLAGGGEDYVMIAPREWLEALQPLIDLRTSEGHHVLAAAIEDVYDQFAGGHHWPHAIRSMLRAMFRRGGGAGPSYLLLVGDASDAFDNPLVLADRNWVPTQTVFSSSYDGAQGPELVASDMWFVDNLTGTGEDLDFLPDMHVGRLPAGSLQQLQTIENRLLAYASFAPDQVWRNRMLLVSDDQYSSSISFSEDYRFRDYESAFLSSARATRRILREYGAAPDFGVDSFYVYTYMDSVPSLGRCVIDENTGRCMRDPISGRVILNGQPTNEQDNRDYGIRVVRPLLAAAASRGYLLMTYAGHANARLMSHEYILRHNDGTSFLDIGLLGNSGRPFVYIGYGCHLDEFSGADEKRFGKGDCVGENMMFYTPTGGSIASIASTGYEWISTTQAAATTMADAFFRNPPQSDGHTRWVLGEVFTQSKANLLSRPGTDYQSMCMTYVMLGDPGMILDAAPPRVAVTLDGAPITSGTPLVLPAGSDSVDFEMAVRDEVWARSLTIEDAGGAVPPDRIVVVPDTTVGDRGFVARYRTTVLPRNYSVVIRAEDGTGRESVLEFPVRLDATFQIRRPGQEWVSIAGGERVLDEDSIRVVVDAPRTLDAASIEMLLDGVAFPVESIPAEPVDGQARHWTLVASGPIANGSPRTLALRVRQPEGEWAQFPATPITIQTDRAFAIEALYNVPNPFEKETWFFYNLGASMHSASIRIYTTSGKLIRTLRGLPVRQGLSDPPVYWDGRDEDGDRVANGLYYYKLSVEGPEGRLEKIEKLAHVR
ncbi:MAG: C25 family cysteine peptidase [Candidatus Eisenbacteria bacterium]